VSAFDDEFGLFGDEAPEEEERRSTLGARQIARGETVIDDIEPEDERPARPRRNAAGGGDRSAPRDRTSRQPADPVASQARAAGLLEFLAKKLVTNPDNVVVRQTEGDRGPIIELEVDPEDLGKVIGRGGRVAQALRTLVRASAEGRVIVDILDVDQDDVEEESDLEHTPPLETTEGDDAQ
jgi:predicted RNA-binding protein YlqC (UPF0109 family)